MKTDDMILLLAKTGLFFANCDGEYSDREKKFISDYIQMMKNKSVLSSSNEQILLNLENHEISFDEILIDTENLLVGFNSTEQQAIVENILDFIQKVINADNRVDKNEEWYLAKWSAHFQMFLSN